MNSELGGIHGAPEHFPLPDQADTETDRAALKILRACCTNYWQAERPVLAFLNLPTDSQRPIWESMDTIVKAARLAYARNALFDGPRDDVKREPSAGNDHDQHDPVTLEGHGIELRTANSSGTNAIPLADHVEKFGETMSQKWSAGKFLAKAKELRRKLSNWHVTDFKKPIQFVTQSEARRWTNLTLRDTLPKEGQETRPERGWLVTTNPDGAKDELGYGGTAERPPDTDTDRSLTQWLMGDFQRNLRTSDATPSFDYLRESFDQLLDLQAWTLGEEQDEQSRYMVIGQQIAPDFLDSVVDAAEKLHAKELPLVVLESVLGHAADQWRNMEADSQKQRERDRQERERKDALNAAWDAVRCLDSTDPRPGEDLRSDEGWSIAYASRLRQLGQLLHERAMMEAIRNWTPPPDTAPDAIPGLMLAHQLLCLGGDLDVPESAIAATIRRILRDAPKAFDVMGRVWFATIRRLALAHSENDRAPIPSILTFHSDQENPRQSSEKQSSVIPPRDGDVNEKGRVFLGGAWCQFGPQQKRLLLWVFQNPNGKVPDVIHNLGLSSDDHFNKLLHDLRTSIAKNLKKSDRSLTIHLEGQTLTFNWTTRQR